MKQKPNKTKNSLSIPKKTKWILSYISINRDRIKTYIQWPDQHILFTGCEPTRYYHPIPPPPKKKKRRRRPTHLTDPQTLWYAPSEFYTRSFVPSGQHCDFFNLKTRWHNYNTYIISFQSLSDNLKRGRRKPSNCKVNKSPYSSRGDHRLYV